MKFKGCRAPDQNRPLNTSIEQAWDFPNEIERVVTQEAGTADSDRSVSDLAYELDRRESPRDGR